jgi:hypothetical protein
VARLGAVGEVEVAGISTAGQTLGARFIDQVAAAAKDLGLPAASAASDLDLPAAAPAGDLGHPAALAAETETERDR